MAFWKGNWYAVTSFDPTGEVKPHRRDQSRVHVEGAGSHHLLSAAWPHFLLEVGGPSYLLVLDFVFHSLRALKPDDSTSMSNPLYMSKPPSISLSSSSIVHRCIVQRCIVHRCINSCMHRSCIVHDAHIVHRQWWSHRMQVMMIASYADDDSHHHDQIVHGSSGMMMMIVIIMMIASYADDNYRHHDQNPNLLNLRTILSVGIVLPEACCSVWVISEEKKKPLKWVRKSPHFT